MITPGHGQPLSGYVTPPSSATAWPSSSGCVALIVTGTVLIAGASADATAGAASATRAVVKASAQRFEIRAMVARTRAFARTCAAPSVGRAAGVYGGHRRGEKPPPGP